MTYFIGQQASDGYAVCKESEPRNLAPCSQPARRATDLSPARL